MRGAHGFGAGARGANGVENGESESEEEDLVMIRRDRERESLIGGFGGIIDGGGGRVNSAMVREVRSVI
jgi:hypothetical protein